MQCKECGLWRQTTRMAPNSVMYSLEYLQGITLPLCPSVTFFVKWSNNSTYC